MRVTMCLLCALLCGPALGQPTDAADQTAPRDVEAVEEAPRQGRAPSMDMLGGVAVAAGTAVAFGATSAAVAGSLYGTSGTAGPQFGPLLVLGWLPVMLFLPIAAGTAAAFFVALTEASWPWSLLIAAGAAAAGLAVALPVGVVTLPAIGFAETPAQIILAVGANAVIPAVAAAAAATGLYFVAYSME